MGVGEMGQIIGETGIGEMGVGEMGTNRCIKGIKWDYLDMSFKYFAKYFLLKNC